jgi:hypothetical protein
MSGKHRTTESDPAKKRPSRGSGDEPKRTPGKAEGDERISPRPEKTPGRTPGQAEGTREDVDHELGDHRRDKKR